LLTPWIRRSPHERPLPGNSMPNRPRSGIRRSAPALADADRRLNLYLRLLCHLQGIVDLDAPRAATTLPWHTARTRSFTRSHDLSLLSIARLNNASSRVCFERGRIARKRESW